MFYFWTKLFWICENVQFLWYSVRYEIEIKNLVDTSFIGGLRDSDCVVLFVTCGRDDTIYRRIFLAASCTILLFRPTAFRILWYFGLFLWIRSELNVHSTSSIHQTRFHSGISTENEIEFIFRIVLYLRIAFTDYIFFIKTLAIIPFIII